jgi:hypothetical protein
MGDVTVRVAGRRGVVDYINGLDDASREIFYQAIDDIGKVGAEEMRRIVKRRTSKHSRSGLKAKLGFSNKGRIRTGAMLDSIGHRPRRGNKLYQAEVGYLKDYQDYFKWQEIGFTNVWKFIGQWNRPYSSAPNAPAGWMFKRLTTGAPKVQGLFALRDARQKMEEATEDIMDKAAARIDRRARRR